MVRVVLLLVGSLPMLAWLSQFVPPLRPMGALLEPWFDLQCHRDPHRTLALLGTRLPVCARCTGIYAGLFLGGLLTLPRASPRGLVTAALVGGTALLLDVSSEALGWRVPSLGIRFVTGVAFAYPAAVAIASQRRP